MVHITSYIVHVTIWFGEHPSTDWLTAEATWRKYPYMKPFPLGLLYSYRLRAPPPKMPWSQQHLVALRSLKESAQLLSNQTHPERGFLHIPFIISAPTERYFCMKQHMQKFSKCVLISKHAICVRVCAVWSGLYLFGERFFRANGQQPGWFVRKFDGCWYGNHSSASPLSFGLNTVLYQPERTNKTIYYQ